VGKIEYCDRQWNPITGCISGLQCWDRCWARRMANRQRGRNGYDADAPFTPTFHPDRLGEPEKWRRPQRVAVSFMGDIALAPIHWLDAVVRAMRSAQRHTFLLLTKRPKLLAAYLAIRNPLPHNVWLGVSVEDQRAADDRIPGLLKCLAAVRWLSVEPMLGPVDLLRNCDWLQCARMKEGGTERSGFRPEIDWVVVGGESGPGARPMHPDWVRSVRDQCQAAGVPWWFKQWGEFAPETADADSFGAFPGMSKIGKKAAGCVLDGLEYHELPTRD